MAYKEQTGKRNLDFSNWIHNNLPQENFEVTDIDFVLKRCNPYRIMLLEVKVFQKYAAEKGKNAIPKWQQDIYGVMSSGYDNVSNLFEFQFLGWHSIIFDNTDPHNGNTYFDGIPITEEELKAVLSMDRESYPPYYYPSMRYRWRKKKKEHGS